MSAWVYKQKRISAEQKCSATLSHRVRTQCRGHMLRAFVADSIIREAECGECLHRYTTRRGSVSRSVQQHRLTLFVLSAAATCSAPLSPILFEEKRSVMSVCMSIQAEEDRCREMFSNVVSPCSCAVRQPDALRLCRRSDSKRGGVW